MIRRVIRILARTYFIALAALSGLLALAGTVVALVATRRYAQEPEDLYAAMLALCGVVLLGGLAVVGIRHTASARTRPLQSWAYVLGAAVVALGAALVYLSRDAAGDATLFVAFGVQCFLATLLLVTVPLRSRRRVIHVGGAR